MPDLDKTEAINLMLAAVGEPEVNAAEVATPTQPVTKKAVRALDAANRKLQLWGWSFNRERNVTLSPVASKIVLPSDVIHVDPDGDSGQYAIRKSGADYNLYDRWNNTFDFTGDIKVELHRLLAFDDIPLIARELVTAKAALGFAEAYLGEAQPTLRADLVMTEGQFYDVESEMSDINLSDSYDIWRSTGRPSPMDFHSA